MSILQLRYQTAMTLDDKRDPPTLTLRLCHSRTQALPAGYQQTHAAHPRATIARSIRLVREMTPDQVSYPNMLAYTWPLGELAQKYED